MKHVAEITIVVCDDDELCHVGNKIIHKSGNFLKKQCCENKKKFVE